METIDQLVQGEETNSGVGVIGEKILTLQSMAIQPVISFRLNHRNEDRASTAKFWEDWQAIVRLFRTKFLARMARQNQEDPVLLGDEPQNAFGDTQAQRDAERCKLVRERDRLKEDLLKVQDVIVDVEQ
ncbi:hypothetical protein R1flu_005309 [Riccia fluitans]|uniref:Uncharacterized protein n=1 Tax=Riccia fluitans TaxID=41844 RepID=A0ABD1YST6_9MARC